ncbi:VOC family protein [Anaerosphaera multitolerans]|uniref:Glyoxalase n=1 Tax=Anaerosphaera multitolerans TaxID=2487351 RepID=A0A437S4F6_9FIRM|nr:VOC family protein [Anaerosphaera multitolerans]RVU53837.1 glyoxalase [Anaerosphaera multitolerans]
MSTHVFVNLPVKNLKKSTAFYESLGFRQNKEFSNGKASAMVWDDNFWIMLLTHDFYNKILKDKFIADVKKVSGALISFSMDSPEAVKKFAEAAKENGGNYYKVDMGIPEDIMCGYEVEDLDGNILEPSWMEM